MGGPSRVPTTLLLLASAMTAGCGHASRAPAEPSPGQHKNAPAPADAVTLKISDLQVDPGKRVHLRGIVSSIVHVHKVPARVVFKISDSATETITVVINELRDLKEGTQVELVGRYKELPSPTHKGPGEPPREAVFEVERILEQR
jgi:hypothetical protein